MKAFFLICMLGFSTVQAQLFTHWKGEWTAEGSSYLYTLEMELEANGNWDVQGKMTWTLEKADESDAVTFAYLKTRIGKTAIEYVKGKYNPSTRTYTLKGIRNQDPDYIITLEKYDLLVSEDGYHITGKTDHHGTWEGRVNCWLLKRTPEMPSVIKKGDKLIFPTVQFKADDIEPVPTALPILNQLVTYMNEHPTLKIAVIGHTDKGSTQEYNQKLSLQRAQAIQQYLIAKGLAKERIKIDGKGSSEPLASNETAEGRKVNRRTEFVILSE
jgi:outer membrane protein OmpA-like peptidoglycan-associated protein